MRVIVHWTISLPKPIAHRASSLREPLRAKTQRRQENQYIVKKHTTIEPAYRTEHWTDRSMINICIVWYFLRVIAHGAISLHKSLGVFASWRESALKDNPFIFVSTHNCDIAKKIARSAGFAAHRGWAWFALRYSQL
jgi:hypothetical protein